MGGEPVPTAKAISFGATGRMARSLGTAGTFTPTALRSKANINTMESVGTERPSTKREL